MPNHIHGILAIMQQQSASPITLGNIIRNFKSGVTRHINCLRIERGLPRVQVWQRNYYEHIIRDEADLWRIRQYIVENPMRWVKDALYAP